MPKYRYLLFDLDGTLTDSAEGILKSVEYALEKFGITIEDPEKLNYFIGPPLIDSFMDVCGFDESQAKKAVELYRERFSSVGIFENRVYDGINELLESLKDAGFTIVMATSKPEEFAKRIATHFGISKYFSHIAGASFDGKIITKAQVIRHAFLEAGINDKSKAIMIGDRHHDTEGAAEVGIDSIGVLYGYGSREELVSTGATFIAETPDDIRKILLK